MSTSRIAIIPARSGSKGLKDKNIADLCGKPVLAYSIEAAINSGLFDRVIVSTDSEKYAEIARKYGAEIMLRGENLSNDHASSFMVIEDVLNRVGKEYDYFVLLQPTSPLRNAQHIKEAVESFDENIDQYDFMVSVTEADHPRVLCNPIEEDLSLKHFDSDFSNYRRQAYKDYVPNGAIFIGKPSVYLLQKHFFGPKAKAFIMSRQDSIDIDNSLDLKLSELILLEKLALSNTL